ESEALAARVDGNPRHTGQAGDRGDHAVAIDPSHCSAVDVGEIEVAGAVEGDPGDLVDARLARGSAGPRRAGTSCPGADGERLPPRVPAVDLVLAAVRDHDPPRPI